MAVGSHFNSVADLLRSQTITDRNILSKTFTIDDLMRQFRVETTAKQFAGWVDRGSFRSAADSTGTAATRQFSFRDGLCAALMAQHVSVICVPSEAAARLANQAAGEIMKSPVFKIITDPDNAPDDEYLLVIARADIWVVRVVRRDELDFTHAYTSLVIDISRLLRDIAQNLSS
jgi:hypothetical protein